MYYFIIRKLREKKLNKIFWNSYLFGFIIWMKFMIYGLKSFWNYLFLLRSLIKGVILNVIFYLIVILNFLGKKSIMLLDFIVFIKLGLNWS